MAHKLATFTKVLARNLGITASELDASFGPCHKEDIPAVSDIRRQVFGELIDAQDEKYLWWRYFSRNPERSTLLCLKHQGRVIAAIGTEPATVKNGDQESPCIKCADAIVAPEYDGRGIGAWMNLRQIDEHEVVIALGGNSNSISLLNKLFTSLAIRQNYRCPVTLGKFLSRRTPGAVLPKIFGPVINVLWRTVIRTRLTLMTGTAPGEVKQYGDVEELASHLSQDASALFSKGLVRTPEYLRWRYSEMSGRQYLFFGLELEGDVKAYVIAKVGFPDSPDASVGMVLDWSYSPDDEGQKQFKKLLSRVLLKLIGDRADMLQMIMNDKPTIRIAERLGMVHRGTDARCFIKTSGSPMDALEQPNGWFISQGDSDGA